MQAAAENNKQWGKKARSEYAQQHGKCMPGDVGDANAKDGPRWEVGSGSGCGTGSLPMCNTHVADPVVAALVAAAPVVDGIAVVMATAVEGTHDDGTAAGIARGIDACTSTGIGSNAGASAMSISSDDDDDDDEVSIDVNDGGASEDDCVADDVVDLTCS